MKDNEDINIHKANKKVTKVALEEKKKTVNRKWKILESYIGGKKWTLIYWKKKINNNK